MMKGFYYRTIIFCGEVVTVGLLERCIKALPNVQFINLYSISEAHDIACEDLTAWYHRENVRPSLFISNHTKMLRRETISIMDIL